MIRGLLLGLSTVFILGCGPGGPSGPAVFPVTGKITYNGSPVPNATLTFIPSSGPVASGQTDENGVYSLKTGSEEGAVAGEHKIGIIAVEKQNQGEISPDSPEYEKMMSGQRPEEKWLIPEKYGNTLSSGLTKTVKEEDNVIDIELTD